MRFKKILSAFLAAAISVSSISVVSSAAAPQIVAETVENTYQASGDSFVDGDLKYTELSDGTLSVTCSKEWISERELITSIVIPSTANGKKVTAIGRGGLSNCSNLTSVTIPNTITKIGDSAFAGCTSLTSITIPSSVTSIDYYAFDGCTGLTSIKVDTANPNYCAVGGVLFNKDKTELIQYPVGNTAKSYTIPNSVTTIARYAFAGCASLTSVTIPNGVKTISTRAFAECENLASVTIPGSVTSIGGYAFKNCTGLTAINVDDANEKYCSVGGVLFNKEKTDLMQYPLGSKAKSYTVPDGTTSISGYAFAGCESLTSVTIPDGVTTIGWYAFNLCKGLKNVSLPSTITIIDDRVFENCESLTSMTIPNGVTKIGEHAFDGCSGLKTLTISESVTRISSFAFASCSGLTSVTIPNSVTEISSFAFESCTNLVSVILPNSITSINAAVFEYCKSLVSIKIPNGVTSINGDAFAWCDSLTSVTIPDSVTSISRRAFEGCTSLASLTIPGSVTSIADDAFSGCIGLTSIDVDDTNTVYCSVDGVVFSKDKTKLVRYPLGKKSKGYTIPDGTTEICAGAFSSTYLIDTAPQLVSITIPTSVKSIGMSAFSYCRTLDLYYTGSSAQWKEIENAGQNWSTSIYFYYNFTTKVEGLKSATTTNSVKLTWNDKPAAIYYKVFVSNNGKWKMLAEINNSSASEYTAKNLNSNTSYKFRVGAYNKGGAMIACTDITAKTKADVEGLTAEPTKNSVKLTWNKYTAAGYYKVWIRKDGKWSQLTQTANNTTLTYTAGGLSENNSYKFRVTAYDKNGKALAYTDITAKTLCGKIADLKASTTKDSVKLTWSKYASASYCKVFVWKNNKWSLLTKTNSNSVVTYTASSLSANTSYKFRVAAYDKNGKAIAYTDITSKTKGKIEGLKAETTKNSVKLTWNKYTAAGYYKVWIWKDGKWTLLTQTANNTTLTYTAGGLSENTSYDFRVTAYDKNGKALAYTDITAKTPCGQIANLKAAPTNNSVKLTWNKYASTSYCKVFIWKNDKWSLLTQTNSSTVVTYTASNLSAATSYKFRVAAYDKSGKAIAYTDITTKTK